MTNEKDMNKRGKTTASNKKSAAASSAKPKTSTARSQSAAAKKEENARRKKEIDEQTAAFYLEQKKRKEIYDEVILIITLLFCLLLYLSYFGLCSKLGDAINVVIFGMLGGILPYLFPIGLFFTVAFMRANAGNLLATKRTVYFSFSMLLIASLIHIFSGCAENNGFFEAFSIGYQDRTGGGLLGAILSKILLPIVGKLAAVLILITLIIICIIMITGKSILAAIKRYRSQVKQMKDDCMEYEENYAPQEEEAYSRRQDYHQMSLDEIQEENRRRQIQLVDAASPRIPADYSLYEPVKKEKKPTFIDKLKEASKKNAPENEPEPIENGAQYADIPEEEFNFAQNPEISQPEPTPKTKPDPLSNLKITNVYENTQREKLLERAMNPAEAAPAPVTERTHSPIAEAESAPIAEAAPLRSAQAAGPVISDVPETMPADERMADPFDAQTEPMPQTEAPGSAQQTSRPAAEKRTGKESSAKAESAEPMVISTEAPVLEKPYVCPPLSLLSRPKMNEKGVSNAELKETAAKLQQTLHSFGVNVTVTDVSCGPSVTRYEIQPEQGVKVSRITALADDIKLNLAAADIRIEAPIPGKAAVGIEVPNSENTTVMLRSLLEANEYANAKAKIAFAVGKDIGGNVIVTDIAKMPHLLIAGATGSGKSVCINTLIMSILFKYDPKDVRLIMVDPKVVELSVYNGIPHLLIPVVTDPKKASSALNWAVMEMTDRYKKFADLGVRDLSSYNSRVASSKEDLYDDAGILRTKLPQIVIIIDELADLMMVAPGEVEDAICRLAQLARAAGIHLVIATQRPSVNVITGLIKANVPSRVAFAVSSSIDSRTILDQGGAEKLLGKGDMLFYPSGIPKPIRVQGAFVSDNEVSAVVDFLKEQNTETTYSESVSNHINSGVSSVSDQMSGSQSPANDRDEYFVEAGRFIIEKDKASIGMLQRIYKIGFNRAARIMDQLAEAGVVGPEEGTKPRKILMTLEEFEDFLNAEQA